MIQNKMLRTGILVVMPVIFGILLVSTQAFAYCPPTCEPAAQYTNSMMTGNASSLSAIQQSYDVTITVTTDKSSYIRGDIITISGHVTNPYPGQDVAVKTTDPSLDDVFAAELALDNNGDFITTLNTASSLMAENGQYTIYVQIGNHEAATAQTQFTLTGIPSTQPSPSQQQTLPQIQLTSGGTIDVGFSTNPSSPKSGSQTNLLITFINKSTHAIQPHIDYKVAVMEGNNQICGTPIMHTTEGSIAIPCQFQSSGTYPVTVYVDGILFQPIPEESTTFSVTVGGSPFVPPNLPQPSYMIPNTTMPSQGASNYQGPAYTITNSSSTNPDAGITVTTDKSSYNSGDTITIFGTTNAYLGDNPLTLILTDPVGHTIHADQITVTSDKTFSASMVAMGALWLSAGTYTADVYYGNENATTTFQFSGSSLAPSGPSTIPVDGTSYSVSYTMTNGTVLDIKADPVSQSLTVSIQTTGDGLLTIDLPRALIDTKNSDGSDKAFVVLNDGQIAQFTEGFSNGSDRILGILFKDGTQQMKIIGTLVVGQGSPTSQPQVPNATTPNPNFNPSPTIPSPSTREIPAWVKTNAGWWANGQVSDADFEKGIEYLIDQKIIKVSSHSQTTSGAQQIPAWVKNTAGMWSTSKISDNDFLRGIEYLAQIGIIKG